MQHTNTSSMSCGSTTGLLCRELGARGSARQTSKMDKVELASPGLLWPWHDLPIPQIDPSV